MKANAKREHPRHLLVVDTEANIEHKGDAQRHTLRLGHAIHLRQQNGKYAEREYPFKTHSEWFNILDHCSMKNEKLYVIAHNAAYDYGILEQDHYWAERHFDLKRFVISQSFMVHARNQERKSTIAFLDSMNWFKSSLRELGKTFGEHKLECPDFEHVSDEELAYYCRQDVVVLKTAILGYLDFIEKHDLGNFQETFASQALGAYRHRFMPDRTLLIHDFPNVLDLEMRSYRGGRTEAFFIGKVPGDIFKVDVNSMYPYVMKQFPYPTKPFSKEPLTDFSIEELRKPHKGVLVLIKAKVDIKKPFLGVKRNKKLVFPVGRLDDVYLVGPEIDYLLNDPSAGELLEIKELVGYRSTDIFSSYVDYFYNIKQTTAGATRLMAKYFMNSLYGKFGQKEVSKISKLSGDEEKTARGILDIVGQNSYWDIEEENRSKLIRIGTDIYRISSPDQTKASPNSMPIISSMVTAYARMYLWQMMELAGLDNIFYCDTDSLFLNRQGYDNLDQGGYLHNERLGALKLEGIGQAEIWGAKLYQFGEDVHRKGIPNGSKETEGRFDYLEWQTKSSRYTNPGAGIALVPRSKVLKMTYDKGIVTESGRVNPLVFAD